MAAFGERATDVAVAHFAGNHLILGVRDEMIPELGPTGLGTGALTSPCATKIGISCFV